LIFKDLRCLQIPLCFVKDVEKTGGVFKKDGVTLALDTRRVNPVYEVDYYKNILKRTDLPPVLNLPESISLRFHDKTRDNFFDLTQEALKRKVWE
jgi:hypothetical protein